MRASSKMGSKGLDGNGAGGLCRAARWRGGAVLWVLGGMLCCGSWRAHAQVPVTGADVGQPPAARRPGDAGEQDAMTARVERNLAEQRNEQRQKALEADTRRLLELAQALEADVSKTNKNELSLDVIKRAEQIEKLAHSVREKMRGYD